MSARTVLRYVFRPPGTQTVNVPTGAVVRQVGYDSNNMVVPVTDYATYSAARNAAGLAIPQASLLSVTPPAMAGFVFGLYPELSELHILWG